MQHILRYIIKWRQVGLFQAARSLRSRFTHCAFDAAWRQKALQKKANHDWRGIAEKYSFCSLDVFFQELSTRFDAFGCDDFLVHYTEQYILETANNACNQIFDILGSGPVTMPKIVWHHDIRLRSQAPLKEYTFASEIYYKDIQNNLSTGQELEKDIKVPWELSRFQHLFFLGKAYELTGDEKYSTTFTRHISDWIEENPFLLGINWLCPMEVALRAINWIWGFYFFKDAPISEEFWQKFVCSLYDHYIYLENTWEFYDGRTSNHYLSDLVGYAYLCYFFSNVRGASSKAEYCFKRILSEMKRQVFSEGTNYEGSTQYHRFVTELFFHASSIMHKLGYTVPPWFRERLSNMFLFIEWCSPSEGVFISIGDHDSSTVLWGGLPKNVIKKNTKASTESVKQYKAFGLSIIKTEDWHITVRHHAYTKRQPSGHFHNDVGSITLAYKGIPVLIDPGSFVYTASPIWRNYFRSAVVHNSFFIQNCEPVQLSDNLFFLDIPEQNTSNDALYMVHHLYSNQGLAAHRHIVRDETTQKVYITDWWDGGNEHQSIPTIWNFTFSPSVTLMQDNNAWLIYAKDQLLLKLVSEQVVFTEEQGWVSVQYGKKEACWALRAQHAIQTHEKIVFFLFPG